MRTEKKLDEEFNFITASSTTNLLESVEGISLVELQVLFAAAQQERYAA